MAENKTGEGRAPGPPVGGYADFVNKTLQIPPVRKRKALDLFAGCGGLSLGFEAAGIDTVGFEMDGDCCMTYRKNLPSECRQVLVTPQAGFPPADIIIGGPPCQPFSRFGKRKGKDDGRNGFPAFIEAVRKVRPAVWACENVRGLCDQDKAYFSEIVKELKSLGYAVDCRVVRMVEYGVPQTRERLIMVGHDGSFRFPEGNGRRVTAGEALGEMAREIPEDAKLLTPAMDAYIEKYERASKCRNPRDLHLDRPARTLTCRNLAGATGDMQRIRMEDGRRRRLTVREAARLQGFPDWFEFCGSEASRFRQIGNAVPPIFAYQLARSVLDCLFETMNYRLST